MFYTGVVENRLDPLKLGRCQVRIFGLHSNNTSELPTEDLPWAFPVQPVTSAAMNGIGYTPLGPVEGTWVIVIFRDKDNQQPLILGTLGGIPQSSAEGSPAPDAHPGNVVTDSSGNVVTDSSGNPIIQGSVDETPEKLIAKPEVDTKGWSLGQSSEKYDSEGRGAGTVNNYSQSDDYDGASYGIYQFASFLPPTMPNGKKRSGWETSTMRKYLQGSRFSAKFSGLTPGTDSFDNAWRQTAQQYPKDFADDQHDYMQKNYYDVLYQKIERAGIDLSENGPAVQDCIWSTAIQYGYNDVDKITRALTEKTKFTDTEFVTLVQNSKVANASTDFPRNSVTEQQNVISRANAEKEILLKLVRSGAESDVVNPKSGTQQTDEITASTQDPSKFDIEAENAKALQKSGISFADPNGKYPKEDFLNEPDTNRLARNMKIASTNVYNKETNSLRSAPMAGGGSWSEPAIPYAGKYPFNHVYESESGHMLEFDDTPECQRVHLYHRAGTYIEIDKNGRQVNHIVGDGYHIIDRNGYIYIAGKCNISVNGSANVYVGANADIEVAGDVNALIGNDLNAQVGGGATFSVNEDLDIRVGGSIIMDAAGDISLRANGNVSLQANGNASVKASGSAYLNSGGNLNIKAGGTGFYTAGGNLELGATGTAKLEGSTVHLAEGAAPAATPPELEASTLAFAAPGRSIKEMEFEELQSSYRGEEDSLFFETPEESTDEESRQQHRIEMINSGKATEDEFDENPISGGSDTTPTSAPNPSIKGDCAKIASMHHFPDNLLLSPNFTLGKVSSRAAATQIPVRAQYNLSKEEIICNLQFLCLNVLEIVKKMYPDVIVTSGFRDYGKSKKVSQHCLGEAVDLQFPSKSRSAYYDIAVALKNAVPYDQLLLEYKNYGSKNPWIHISLKRNGSNRKQILTMFNDRQHSQGLSRLA